MSNQSESLGMGIKDPDGFCMGLNEPKFVPVRKSQQNTIGIFVLPAWHGNAEMREAVIGRIKTIDTRIISNPNGMV
jgi:hypothetical protein